MVVVLAHVFDHIDDPVSLKLGTGRSVAQRRGSLRAISEEPRERLNQQP